MRFIHSALVALAFSTAGRAAENLVFEVDQITSGPRHHLFGYIGQCRTIAWNEGGRYIVALRVGFHDRMPKPEDAADIILIDTHRKNHVISLDRTHGWNFQQGTMLYWHPRAPKTRFFFNDRDVETGKVFTVLYDFQKRSRVREYHFDDTPVANAGVAQGGDAFAALSYGRLARLRLVTGYPGALDWSKDEHAPENDGVFLVDIESGEKRLLVSYAELSRRLAARGVKVGATGLFINHTLWNRDDDRIYFFVRGGWSGQPRSERINMPCSISPDGSRLTLHEMHIGGHPEWGEGKRLIGRQGDRQILYDVDAKRIVGQLGTPDIFPKPEGDISLSPDGSWLVNGFSLGGKNFYTVYRMADGLHGRSPGFDKGSYSGDLRIDPAPRWNRDSDAILVPGIAEDGTRQLFVVRVRISGAKD